MTAFSYATTCAIHENITTMYRRLARVSTKPITHTDFLNLFVPEGERPVFRTMKNLSVANESNARYIWSNGVPLTFSLLSDVDGRSLPRPRGMVLQPDAPPALVEEITYWTGHGGDASGDCGRILTVFDRLNSSCTRSQLRFLWPSILAILTIDLGKQHLIDKAKELQELRPPKDTPALPAGVIQACRKTAGTVSMISIIPHDILEREVERSDVVIRTTPGRSYAENGLNFTGMVA